MRDLESYYAALASDVVGSGLPTAGDLRRAADRHAHRRASVVGGAVVAALTAGGSVALLGGPATTPDPAPPSPTSDAPTTPPPAPTITATPPSPTGPAATNPPAPPPTSAAPVIRSIPERAFFDLPRDMRKDGLSRKPWAGGLPEVPALCDDPLRDDPAATARRSFYTHYKGANEPDDDRTPLGTVTQTVIAYRPGDAADLMRRVREDVASCDTRESGTWTITITTESAPRHGDEAIQVLEKFKAPADNDGPTEWDARTVIIRVDDVVTVVKVDGWESSTTEPDDVPVFARLAVEAIEEWRN